MRLRNAAQQLLRASGITGEQLAVATGCQMSTAGNWLCGMKPNLAQRRAMARTPLEIDPSWWEIPPRGVELDADNTAAVDAPYLAGAGFPSPLDNPDDEVYVTPDYNRSDITRHLLIQQVERIRRARHDAQQRNVDKATLLKLEKSETDVLKVLGRANGELSRVDEDRLTRTDRWVQLRKTIVDALGPYKEARSAVIAAIREYDRDAN